MGVLGAFATLFIFTLAGYLTGYLYASYTISRDYSRTLARIDHYSQETARRLTTERDEARAEARSLKTPTIYAYENESWFAGSEPEPEYAIEHARAGIIEVFAFHELGGRWAVALPLKGRRLAYFDTYAQAAEAARAAETAGGE